ncbi:MAG: S8 family serine peptidase [Phycisphaerales bacterium]
MKKRLTIAALLSAAALTASASADGVAGTLHLKTGDVNTAKTLSLLTPKAKFDAEKRYVLQLDGPMTAAKRAALDNAGVVTSDYLPDYAYVADLSHADSAKLSNLGFVTWVGAFDKAWKLEPAWGTHQLTEPDRAAALENGQRLASIVCFADADPQPVVIALTNLGGQLTDMQLVGDSVFIEAWLPTARAGELAAQDHVQWIEEAPQIQLRNDTNRWILQSNVSNSTPVWDKGIHGEGQIGGLIDGAMKEAHCMFDDAVAPGPTHRKIIAYHGTSGSDSHGTHTAGTFVGDQTPFGTYTTNDGLAFAAKLSFTNSSTVGSSNLYSAFITAHNEGARVHSNSWGDDSTTAYTTHCRQIDQYTWEKEDGLVAFAVTNLSALKTPENSINVLGVGASQDTPSQANHCSGGTGPTADGRRKPEAYAPGCSTNSANSGTTCGVVGMTGTSMACPAVSGAGLLVRQYFTDGFYPTGAAVPANSITPSGALIKAVLLNSTVDMTGISGYPSNSEGWGRVLLDNALYFAGDASKLYAVDVRNAQGLSTGGQSTYTFSVNSNTKPLKVAMVFTGPPAAVNASNPVINNLDLEVTDPSNATYKGNVFTSGQSSTGGSADAKNNVEMVLRTTPATGTYTVTIKGTGVNQSTQGYALVVTGDVSTCTSPSISDQPDSLTVTDNQSALFSVTAAGTSIGYQWKKDGNDISGANASSYSIAATDLNDSGSYTVVISNSCGSLESNPAVLTVNPCPADLNADGFVNGDDYDAFASAFDAGEPGADFNHDGFVNGDDYDAFASAFEAGC